MISATSIIESSTIDMIFSDINYNVLRLFSILLCFYIMGQYISISAPSVPMKEVIT